MWVRNSDRSQWGWHLISATQSLECHWEDSKAEAKKCEGDADAVTSPEVDACCHLGSQLQLLAVTPTCGLSLWLVWASLPQDSCVPRASVLREPSGNCVVILKNNSCT